MSEAGDSTATRFSWSAFESNATDATKDSAVANASLRARIFNKGRRREDALRRNTALTRVFFSSMAAILDFAVVLWMAIFVETAYNFLFHGWNGLNESNLHLCFFVAMLFVVFNVARHSYSICDYLDLSGHGQRIFAVWNAAFLTAVALGFFAKTIEESSRGALVILYLACLLALYAGRAIIVVLTRRSALRGGVLASRVILVGFERDIETFLDQNEPVKQGMGVVATTTLCDDENGLDEDLARATAAARRLTPDDIIIVVPLTRADVIDRCVSAFLGVPAAIHVHFEQESVLGRFSGAQISGFGATAGFRVQAYSMNSVDIVMKRMCDMALSSIAIVLLTPVFLLVALAIKLDSPGPVLFFQTRHGFNKEPFRIAKFRSMTTMEDGSAVRQVTAQDLRITRVGRFIRKFNLDELPQLVNVLRGQMSLVGPRPHALVHDQQFEREIALYARRHNVKPGITGWAQVNGLRGETNTSEKISQRVHHDLYYIDNWSFPLDIWILFLTVFSRKAYANAV